MEHPFSESEAVYYNRKLSRLRNTSQHIALACDTGAQRIGSAELEELDVLVRTLVSDLRDLQLLLRLVPLPSNSEGRAVPGCEELGDFGLRVGPLHFPAYRPSPSTQSAAAGTSFDGHGPWDFSVPSSTAPALSLGAALDADERAAASSSAATSSAPSSRPLAPSLRAAGSVHAGIASPSSGLSAPSITTVTSSGLPSSFNNSEIDSRGTSGGDMSDGLESDDYDDYDDDDGMRKKSRSKTKRKTTSTTKRKPRGPKGMIENPVCGHCGTKTTPEWRTGPNGILLCNACGLKWSRKRQKRSSVENK